MYIKSYKELIVWQKSILLVKNVFQITTFFPQTELYGLIAQLRRAAISIPSNIAEGYGRKSVKEYVQFLSIAYGSALEVETQLIIAKELSFITVKQYENIIKLLEEVLKMLNAMTHKMKSLNANS